MRVVGIKQLKRRLYEDARLAKAGESVMVTERDVVVAELRPVRRQALAAGRLDDILEALAASGELSRAAQPKGRWGRRSEGLGLARGTTQALLGGLREDGRRPARCIPAPPSQARSL